MSATTLCRTGGELSGFPCIEWGDVKMENGGDGERGECGETE